jgi:hypothetical protein
MTIYGATDGKVVGQPISPFFGAQNGANAAAPVIQAPAGINVTMLEAASRGSLPRNANATAVNGVSTGAQNPTPIDDLMGNGAGQQVNSGVAVPGVAGNPASNGAINQQSFVEGTSAGAATSTGPDPYDTESLTSAPVSGATLVSNLTLSGFQG